MKKIFIGLLLFVSCLSIFLFKPPKVSAYGEINFPNFQTVEDYFYISNIGFYNEGQIDNSSLGISDLYIYYTLTLNEFNEIVFTFNEIEFTINHTSSNGDLIVSDDFDEFYYYDVNTYLTIDDIRNITYEEFLDNFLLYVNLEYLHDISNNDNVLNIWIFSNSGNYFDIEFNCELNETYPTIINSNIESFVFENALTDLMYQAYISNSLPEPLDPNVDMWSWLGDTIGGFMDFEIFPSFSIGAIFNIVISIALFLIFLKVFVGG